MNTPENAGITAALIAGAVTINLKYMNSPAFEAVTFKLIPISKIPDYLGVIGDINKLAELVCEKPAGWADTLEPESLFALDEAIRRHCDPLVSRWVQRQSAAVKQYKPMAQQISA